MAAAARVGDAAAPAMLSSFLSETEGMERDTSPESAGLAAGVGTGAKAAAAAATGLTTATRTTATTTSAPARRPITRPLRFFRGFKPVPKPYLGQGANIVTPAFIARHAKAFERRELNVVCEM